MPRNAARRTSAPNLMWDRFMTDNTNIGWAPKYISPIEKVDRLAEMIGLDRTREMRYLSKGVGPHLTFKPEFAEFFENEEVTLKLFKDWTILVGLEEPEYMDIFMASHQLGSMLLIHGFDVPMSLLENFLRTIVKRFPEKIQLLGRGRSREPLNTPTEVPEKSLEMFGNIWNPNVNRDFETVKIARATLVWLSRRCPYENWSKALQVIWRMRNEMGPHAATMLDTLLAIVERLLTIEYWLEPMDEIQVFNHKVGGRVYMQWLEVMFMTPAQIGKHKTAKYFHELRAEARTVAQAKAHNTGLDVANEFISHEQNIMDEIDDVMRAQRDEGQEQMSDSDDEEEAHAMAVEQQPAPREDEVRRQNEEKQRRREEQAEREIRDDFAQGRPVPEGEIVNYIASLESLQSDMDSTSG